MDPSTGSVYLAKGPSQRITAFANSACNPGKDNADILGSVGGPCVDTTNRFDTGIIQSVLFDVPVICTIGKLVSGLPEEAANALGAAIDAGLI